MSFKPSEIGLVPEQWDIAQLITYLDLITYGFTNPMPDTDEGPWKITAKDVINGHINYDTARHTSQEAFDNDLTSKSKPQLNDILLTKDGSIGRVAVVDRNGICINQSVALLRPNEKILPYFLKYLLLTPHYQRVMERDSSGSTIKHIYITRVDKMQVAVPTLSEQKEILKILMALDDKIELNRRMNETLEAMARAVFKSWFVDFDPVRAKAEGRDTGLPEEITDLFPDSFEETELGEVPKGWRVGTLENYVNLNPENWSKDITPESIEYVDLANTKWGTIDSTSTYLWKNAPSRAQRVLRSGDTIIGTVRPGNGSYSIISENGLTGSTGFAVLRPKNVELVPFVYLASTSRDNIERLAHLADGGAYPAVRSDVVIATPVIHANTSVLEWFARIVKPMIDKIEEKKRESRTLAKLRDTLLPKLISGEIRIESMEGT